MSYHYPLLLALGTLAVSSSLVILITDIISIILYQSPSTSKAEVIALVSFTLHGTTLVLMALLVCQYFKHHNPHLTGKLKPRGYLIAFAGASCLISSAVTALELVLDKHRRANTSSAARGLRPPENLVIGAVISGTASMLSQCTFVICLACLRRKNLSSGGIESQVQEQSAKMEESDYNRPSSLCLNTRLKFPTNNKPTNLKVSLKHHSLKIVEKLSATKSYLRSPPHSPKDMSSNGQSSIYEFSRSQTPNLLLLDRNNRDNEVGKTSTEIQPTQSVESLSLPHIFKAVNPSFQFLETIPASPTDPSGSEDSRSMLPLCPQPVARRQESTRSFSPANSYRESRRYSRSPTPVEINRESHIHPLFRTDSSDPPPAVTPGTIVTAAPGAGQVISNRASLRSLKSKKSGSSLQSRRKNFYSNENAPSSSENENRGRLKLQEPLPTYGMTFEATR